MPLVLTGFHLTREYHDVMSTFLTFEWDPPQGSGSEAVVDNYTISISPSPLSHPSTIVVTSPLWNVTLAHNTIYRASITAMNCAGEGVTFIPANIEYGKL